MGPICDRLGLEQGGVNSDRLYKLCNNSLLNEAHQSRLGVDMDDGLVVSSIGQADDVVLLANSALSLNCLLHLTVCYCARNNVSLVPEKTKLLLWLPTKMRDSSDLLKLECISIDDFKISYSLSAEHVGVGR